MTFLLDQLPGVLVLLLVSAFVMGGAVGAVVAAFYMTREPKVKV